MAEFETASWVAEALAGRPHRFLSRTSSTNIEAAQWAEQGAPFGAVVVTDEQTVGRGRQGRAWQAAAGSSVLMSVILRPQVPAEALPRITLLGAVALADVLADIGLRPQIKWPNDVQLTGRKVAGILAEASWAGDKLQAVVLGIGVNVTRDALAFQDAETFGATTLETVLGRVPDRGAILRALLERVEFWQGHLLDDTLLAAWRSYSTTLGQRLSVNVAGKIWYGVAEAIDAHGALLLRTDDGELHRLLAGDATMHGMG